MMLKIYRKKFKNSKKNSAENIDDRQIFICNDRKCIFIRNLDERGHVKDVTARSALSKDTLHKKMLFTAIARLHCGLNNRNLSFIP